MTLTGSDSTTIFALSTAGLPSAIAIIRLSGPDSSAVLETLAGRFGKPRRASVALLREPGMGTPIDRAMTLWLPGPDTVTGEDMAEFHIHGSRAVAAKLLAVLGNMAGLRAAEAGEFTRRAFLNGKMDLSETEGLGDLLAAENESQRLHALAMAEGGLAKYLAGWRNQLLEAEAELEAALNFSDEGDVDEGDEYAVLDLVQSIHYEIKQLLAQPPAERLRDGIRVVLAGPPNSGKSTLFNTLIAREAAIVSPIAGTTRDIIEAPVVIDGLAFVFFDTAGLRNATDAIEDEGIKRARQSSAQADIILWLGDPSEAPDGDHCIILHPRADGAELDKLAKGERLAVSAKTGEGMDALRALLLNHARTLVPREDVLALNLRQRQALRKAGEALDQAQAGDWILLVEHLRQARVALDRLSGRGGVEDMLDALFGRFCIGK